MASKLELRFTDTGTENTSITIATGITYTFKVQRLGYRQVSVGNFNTRLNPSQLASSFKDAFNVDDNYHNLFTTNYYISSVEEGVVTIEHQENTFFDNFVNNASGFVISSITTTEQEVPATLEVALSQSPTDICGRFNLNATTNLQNARVTIEIPIGNQIAEYFTGVAGNFSKDLDRIRPVNATSGVVKLFGDEVTTTVEKSVFFTAPGVLSITNVPVNGTPFGAVATIEAVGKFLEYSLNGVDFTGSKEFSGLLAGNYTAYVKDSYGCTKTRSFEVTEEQAAGMTVDPYWEFPIHNSIPCFDRNVAEGNETFLNYLPSEMPGHSKIHCYAMDYLVGDTVREQFRSAMPVNKIYLINENEEETEIAVVKKSNNINRVNIHQGNYKDFEGRLAVYFDAGNIYNPDGSVQEFGHNLGGILPNWYEEGLYLNIEGVGVTQIDRIFFDEDSEIVYAITLKDGIGEGLGKKITSIHVAHPYEIYEFEINFPTAGKYQFRYDYGTGFALSPVIKIWEELEEDFITLQWFNKANNDIVYGTGIKQFRRVKWEDYFSLIPESEIENNRTDTTSEKVNSMVYPVYNLSLDRMPMEIYRGLQTGVDASTDVLVNGVKFASEKPVEHEDLGQWYLPKLQLTLVDQVMNGQQDLYDVIVPEFLIVSEDANGVGFLRL